MRRFNLPLFFCFCLCLVSSLCLFAEAPSPEKLLQDLSAHIKYQENGPNTVGYITIDDRTSGINESTWLYVKKALEYYRDSEHRPILIILELNTPGGEVFAAQKISDALKELDVQNDIPVVAYINNWAISAGAMLAYSCRYIAAVKDASMGAAEPVLASETGEMKSASEKINSALRTDFANRAAFFNRNPYIAEAMVDKDIILVMRKGQIIKLDAESQIISTGPEPDTIISPKGKLLTLDSEQMLKYGVADLRLMPEKLEPISKEERSAGKWPAKKELLFHQPFFNKIPEASIDKYQMDWKTRFFVILAHPAISSLLLLGLMMGFYMEMSSPGVGLPAALAFVCLFLIILAYLSLDIANWLEVILLVTGLAVISVDLWLLPTFGLIGVVGVIMALAGLFGILLPELHSVNFDFNTQTVNAAGDALSYRLAWLCGTIILGVILMVLLSRYLTPKFTAWNRLVLTGSEQDASAGYVAGLSKAELPKVGDKGVVLATLRPSGKVMVGDRVFDAITAGTFLEKGTSIVVVGLEGSAVIVDSEVSS